MKGFAKRKETMGKSIKKCIKKFVKQPCSWKKVLAFDAVL